MSPIHGLVQICRDGRKWIRARVCTGACAEEEEGEKKTLIAFFFCFSKKFGPGKKKKRARPIAEKKFVASNPPRSKKKSKSRARGKKTIVVLYPSYKIGQRCLTFTQHKLCVWFCRESISSTINISWAQRARVQRLFFFSIQLSRCVFLCGLFPSLIKVLLSLVQMVWGSARLCRWLLCLFPYAADATASRHDPTAPCTSPLAVCPFGTPSPNLVICCQLARSIETDSCLCCGFDSLRA